MNLETHFDAYPNYRYGRPGYTSPPPTTQTPSQIADPDPGDHLFPACIINGCAVSKTFHIKYRGEDVELSDIVLFKIELLVDPFKVISIATDTDYYCLHRLTADSCLY